MYRVDMNGTPFLINSLTVKQSAFLSHDKAATINPTNLFGIMGNAAHFDKEGVIKSAIGEHIERTSLYINLSTGYEMGKAEAFSLITGEKYHIPMQRIFLSYSNPTESKPTFNDSCGVGSHLSSNKAIESAFLEFIERQSLILNWLTASKGDKYNWRDFRSKRIKYLSEETFNFIDELYLVDISIHRSVFVIYVLAFGDKYMGLGIAAHWNLETATYNALKEVYQCFHGKKNKEFAVKENRIKEKIISINDPHYYSKFFFNNYNSKKLKALYSYLINSESKSIENNRETVNTGRDDFSEKISVVSRDLGIDILVSFIPTVSRKIKTKIVKVFSVDAFPHMNTTLYNPELFPICKQINAYSFPNKYKPIPFP